MDEKLFVLPEDRYIEHFGVKGMHWGVRKDGKPQGFQYGQGNSKRSTARTAATAGAIAGAATYAYQKKTNPRAGSGSAARKAAKIGAATAATTVAGKYAYDKAKEYQDRQQQRISIDRYSSKEDAIRARDLEYIQRYQDNFSTKEINDVINRVNTERNLANLNRQVNPTTKDQVKKIMSNPIVKTAVVGAAATGGIILINNTSNFIKSDNAYKEALKNGNAVNVGKPSFSDIWKDFGKDFKKSYVENLTNISTSKLNTAMGMGKGKGKKK